MNQNELQADPVREWIGAYHDGELSGERRAWVEEHLATCAGCQAELESLRMLSGLLHADEEPAIADSRGFAGGVVRRLSGPAQPRWQRYMSIALRYAPLGMFAVWAFAEVILWVSGSLLFGLSLFPGLSGIVPSGPETSLPGLLLNALNSSVYADVAGTFDALSRTPWLNPLALVNVGIVAVLAVFFLAWLAGWWTMYRQGKTLSGGQTVHQDL